MKLNGMTDLEKQVLGTLVRVMVGVDGEYSAAESAALEEAAQLLGEDEFWAVVRAAGEKHHTEEAVKAQAGKVERQEAREEIYSVLFAVAAAGSIVGQEGGLLDWLAGAWGLDAASQPPQEA